MKLDLTEEQEMVRDTARRFLEKEMPLSAIRNHYASAEGFTRGYWRQASELGWTSLGVPQALGGFTASGRSGQDLAIVAEEIGRLVGAGPFLPTAVSLDALSRSASFADHKALIEQITSGAAVIAWAFGEPVNEWRPSAFKTHVSHEAGVIVLDGVKAYVEAGAEAEFFVVTAQSEQGLVQVLTPSNAVGVQVLPGRSIDFVRRFAQVRFDQVRLPRTALLFDAESAAAQVERQYQLALLLQCAESNGALECAFEFTVDYMRQRRAFGRTIASFQALKHRLADTLLKIQSCMATTDEALQAFDMQSPDARKLSRIAKTYVARNSTTIVSDFVQMTGGIGVTWEHDLHLYERRIAINRAVFGTPEDHRAEVFQMISA